MADRRVVYRSSPLMRGAGLPRHGVSDTIIGYLKEYCAEHGIGSLRVDTHHGNYPMIRMLERAGFTRCGVVYLRNGEHRVAYELPIAD